MVKTRFAPSPTGNLHIGGARTCLFSWLYAKRNKGKFVLRIEDTDRQRSRKEYLDEILESLKWLGVNWDELFYQSQRFDIYREYAEKLIREGKAYRKDGAVFFKYRFDEIRIPDLIRGEIVFKELPKQEDVIIKSDLSPAYNFCCVVDDALMGITQVIRGEDHISNTPKQVLIYKGLGFPVPEFAHLPLILSEQGGRMSKRFGATALSEYRALGYLPEAIVNYLLLLGWSPDGNREIISLKEAAESFEIKKVNKTSAAFSLKKFNWVNNHYLKTKSAEDLYGPLFSLFEQQGIELGRFDKEYVLRVISLLKERSFTLSDLARWSAFCFKDEVVYAEDTRKILERDLSKEVKFLKKSLANTGSFDKTIIEEVFRKTCSDLGLKPKDLVHPVRVALTGERIGAGLFETIEVLGKEKTLVRLNRLIKYWEGK